MWSGCRDSNSGPPRPERGTLHSTTPDQSEDSCYPSRPSFNAKPTHYLEDCAINSQRGYRKRSEEGAEFPLDLLVLLASVRSVRLSVSDDLSPYLASLAFLPFAKRGADSLLNNLVNVAHHHLPPLPQPYGVANRFANALANTAHNRLARQLRTWPET